FVLTISTEKLCFNGNRKILILQHSLGVLGVKHRSGIPGSPTFSAICLLSYKTIFYLKQVIGVGFVIENMAILLVELVVTIVADLHQTIFYPKGICEIVIQIMRTDLNRPIIYVFAVKKRLPLWLF